MNINIQEFESVYRVTVQNRRDVIEVYKPRHSFGKLQPAEINWSALGSVTPEYAEFFAEGLAKAICLAKYENTKAGLDTEVRS